MKIKKLLLFICLALTVLSLVACQTGTVNTGGGTQTNEDEINKDTSTSTDTSGDTSTGSSGDTSTDTSGDVGNGDDATTNYFVATVNTNSYVKHSPYTGGTSLPSELEGIYYSATSPGATPTGDGTGDIWLTLTPLKDMRVSRVVIEGEFAYLTEHDGDVYCINDVKSDLDVIVYTAPLISSQSEMLLDYGYGISDDGKLTVTWQQSQDTPLRYVEIIYTDSSGSHTEYIDASLGEKELFTMTENKIYNLSISALGKKEIGKKIDISCCYMKAPKEVKFPRVEITTQNFVWPSCDFVSSPDDCWGAGITNAFYEQCIMTLYNENNEVVYASSLGGENGHDYNGAKLKIRGNTSARYASKARYPYKLKLEEKFDLLAPLIGRSGELDGYADRDWVLLNYGNDGYRISGDAIADAVGTEWSPDYCYVSLYLNGEYRGLYVLSEAVEEGNGEGDEAWRVNVDSDGFVFECDAYWWNEDYYFSTPLTKDTPMYFTFKYPDPDEKPDYTYLRDYLIKFEEALKKNDDSYLEYIDLDSFVKWLLVSDYLCINDGGGCNIFLYKKDATDETKLCMGPNWDFDSYMGSVEGLSVIRMDYDGAPFYYRYLIKKPSFQKRYNELFFETRQSLEEYVNDAFARIDEKAHTELLRYDNLRFGTSVKSLSTRKNTFLSWLSDHLWWMETKFQNQ